MALGTQDKVRVRAKKRELARLAERFSEADLGDRADRVGPAMVKLIQDIAELEDWA